MRSALDALRTAEQTRLDVGNENAGFLSASHGLLPISPPVTALPVSHDLWDGAAAHLPALFRTCRARRFFEDLPVLPADAEALPDRYLLRACALLGIFAHSYVRVQPEAPGDLPRSIVEPWGAVSRRLGRSEAELTYDDLVAYNWRFRGSGTSRRVEDLELLIPTVGNQEEQVFYLAQVEILAEGAPMIAAMARAQRAADTASWSELTMELATLIQCLDRVSSALEKVDPNPYSPTHVDPAVWAKTVAPLSVAIRPGGRPVSGAATPLFQLLDVFMGRGSYETRVGQESARMRPSYSPNLRSFLQALGGVRVVDLVGGSNDSEVQGAWRCLAEAYMGDHGFLGVHRRKAYAYLEVAFKVGRAVTTGGFSGLFEEQTWEAAHRELELARLERYAGQYTGCPALPAVSVTTDKCFGDGVTHLRIDASGLGLWHRPGDRLAVRAVNPPGLVTRTLASLCARGDELVPIDGAWRAALEAGDGTGAPMASTRTIVEHGVVRRVGRHAARALLDLTGNDRLRRIVNARAEGSWVLADLLDMLAAAGFDPAELWTAPVFEAHALARLIPPERPRLYSLSAQPGGHEPGELELMVRPLRYEVMSSDLVTGGTRDGIASSFLARVGAGDGGPDIPVTVASGRRFRLPPDPSRPIVMLAGGVGVSPFRYFLAARPNRRGLPADWLFVTARSTTELDALRAELAERVAGGDLVFPAGPEPGGRRDNVSPIASLLHDHRDELVPLAADAPTGAYFYVCGPVGFAATVTATLEAAIGEDRVRRLIGAGRLTYDVFTGHDDRPAVTAEFDHSEIARHNDEVAGYWTIIDGDVFDMTAFAHHHAGGMAILHEVAGRDATSAFRTVDHDSDPAVSARLAMYRIGSVRRLQLFGAGGVTIDDAGLRFVLLDDVYRAWVRMLHVSVEVQNAVRQDFSVLDRITIVGDNATEMTALKARMLLDTHERLLHDYLAIVAGDRLRNLWNLTAALCNRSLDVRTLVRRLDVLTDRAAATTAAANEWRTRLTDVVRTEAGPEHLREFAQLRTRWQQVDERFLADVKAAYTAGVTEFEKHGRTVVSDAGARLIGGLLSVVDAVASFHDGLRTAFAP